MADQVTVTDALSRSATAAQALGVDPGGQVYQRRGHAVLPLLVRQARLMLPVTYQQLSRELGIPNERTLNWPLGAVARSLADLSAAWGHEVPRIQGLVVNKASGLPGEGFAGGLPDPAAFRCAPRRQQRAVLRDMARAAAAYEWAPVLVALKAAPAPPPQSAAIGRTEPIVSQGESPAHLAFKWWVAARPRVVGARGVRAPGQVEYPLPSGDVLDVLFEGAVARVGVEVKSRVSSAADLERGIFQVVKYRAVLEACGAAAGDERDIRVVLAVEGTLPPSLWALANTLDVDVSDGLGGAGV